MADRSRSPQIERPCFGLPPLVFDLNDERPGLALHSFFLDEKRRARSDLPRVVWRRSNVPSPRLSRGALSDKSANAQATCQSVCLRTSGSNRGRTNKLVRARFRFGAGPMAAIHRLEHIRHPATVGLSVCFLQGKVPHCILCDFDPRLIAILPKVRPVPKRHNRQLPTLWDDFVNVSIGAESGLTAFVVRDVKQRTFNSKG